MNLKSITLLVGLVALLAACGGDKQDSNLDGGTVLLSRSNASGEQFALVDGDFQSQDDAKAFVEANGESIEWKSASELDMDEEFEISADQGVAQTSRGHNGRGNRGRRHNGRRFRRHGHHGGWRPHSRRWTHRRWQTPRVTYWGYNRCGSSQILFNGRCCYPYSRAYNSYRWQPQWGWNYQRPVAHYTTTTTTTTTSSWYVRVWF